jgi:hypothetical protein
MVRHEDLRQPDESAKTPGPPSGDAVINWVSDDAFDTRCYYR